MAVEEIHHAAARINTEEETQAVIRACAKRFGFWASDNPDMKYLAAQKKRKLAFEEVYPRG